MRNFLKVIREWGACCIAFLMPLIVCYMVFCATYMIKSIRALEDRAISLTYDDVKHIVIPPFSNRQGWYSGVGGTEMTIEDLYNTELERFRMELDKYEGKK